MDSCLFDDVVSLLHDDSDPGLADCLAEPQLDDEKDKEEKKQAEKAVRTKRTQAAQLARAKSMCGRKRLRPADNVETKQMALLAVKGDYERRSRWKRMERLDQMRAHVAKYENLIRESLQQAPNHLQQLLLECMELRRQNYELGQQLEDHRHFHSIIQMEFVHGRSWVQAMYA